MKKWIISNAVICIIVVIVTLFTAFDFVFMPYLNDFSIYYYTSKTFFESDPTLIYNAEYMFETYSVLAYRYLPAELFVFYLFVPFGLNIAYVIFSAISYVLNLLSAFFLYRIAKKILKEGWEVMRKYIIVFFLMTFHFSNYMTGQVSAIIAFCVTASIYFYFSKRIALSSLFIGLSFFFKPISAFVIIFSILASSKSHVLKRIIFIVIPLIPDAILFLTNRGLISGFIKLNFVDLNETSVTPSISFSNLFNTFGVSSTWVMIFGIVFLVSSWFFISKHVKDKGFFAITYGILCHFLIMSAVWDTQVLFLYPVLAVVYAFYGNGQSFKIYILYPLTCSLFAFAYAGFPLVILAVIVSIATLLLSIFTISLFVRPRIN